MYRREMWVRLFVLLLALAMTPIQSAAQVLYGSLLGNVTDETGLAVPGATVTITHKASNQSRQTTTNMAGAYSFTTIQPGTYTVNVAHEGFTTFNRADVPVTINTISRVNVTLRLGAVAETVTVTGEAASLQTDRAEVRAELPAKNLENLPVPIGRNYQNLFRILPGFRPPTNAHSVPTNPSRALTFNVNGVSQSINNTRIDGASSNAPWLPHVTSFVPTLEAIETVNVVTNSFDAEQGLAGGGAVNVQVKSGTNNLHGSLFEYHTNNKLKATPWITPAGFRNPKLVSNEFGGTLGGPIKHDKLFYFASYEGSLNREFASNLYEVPTAAMRRGDLSAVSNRVIYDPMTGNADGTERSRFPGNIIPEKRISPIATRILNLTPLPNLPGIADNFYGGGAYKFDRHRLDSKVNWLASDRVTAFGRFSLLDYSMNNPEVFGGGNGPQVSSAGGNPGTAYGTTYSFTGAVTYTITPQLVMDSYFGYTLADTNIEQSQLDENVGLDILGIPGTNGARRIDGGWPLFNISNFTQLGVPNDFYPYFRRDPQYQIVTNFGRSAGAHELRFGFDFYLSGMNHSQPEAPEAFAGASGGFRFRNGPTQTRLRSANGTLGGTTSAGALNALGSFLLGLPSEIGRTFQRDDEYHTRAWAYSLYIRDKWNITPRLTFNFGTRWEYFPFPTRGGGNGLEVYNPDTNMMMLCGVGSVPLNCGIEESKMRFAPRVGLAWRATETFVVRAGYGITNDPYSLQRDFRTNYPMMQNLVVPSPTSLLWAGTLEDGIPLPVVPDVGNGIIDVPGNIVVSTVPQKVRRGYVQSWNFTLQKQLPWGFVGQAGYVATRSTRHLGRIDLNAGQIIGAGQAGRPLRQKFGRTATTILTTPHGTTHYNAMQATLERRFSNGLQLGLAYTWSKAIGFAGGSDNLTPVRMLDAYRLNRTLLGYDRTHMFHISNIWELPFGRGKRFASTGAPAAILGGWQVNNVISMMTGTPFTVTASGSSLDLPGSNQTPDLIKDKVETFGNVAGSTTGLKWFDTSAFAAVNDERFGTMGRNALRGPGLVNWDFSIFRSFHLTESWKLEFRAESFNFSNTPHFSNPQGSFTNSRFGEISGIANILGRDGKDERQFRLGLRMSF